MTHIAFKILLCWNYFVPVLNACTDRTPLGMANGLINASQITAKSTWVHGNITASRGRLYSSGAWCSNQGTAVGDYKNEWFQVRFIKQTIINGIATQGDPNWKYNFIIKFKLQYSTDGINWINKTEEFIGNANNKNVVYNWFKTPMVATYVRLYATHIKRHTEKGGHACMRMELYGCLQNNILLPLGMSSGIIRDTQLQNSRGNDARKARLFLPGKGMYATSNNPIYLQVDLIKAKTVTGISMQGVFRQWAPLEILKYTLSYSNNKTTFIKFNQDFQENKDLGAIFNALTPPTTMKHIRITTTICVTGCGIKVEIYGYDPECSQMLTDMITSRKSGSSVTNVNIDSPAAWCATDASDYIHVKFNKRLAISGIILQGDSNEDNWVETYTINVSTNRDIKVLYILYMYVKSHLDPHCCLYSWNCPNLIGVNSRISPLSVNWLNPYIVTNYLRILPTSCKNNTCCLRFQLKGCPFVLEKPHTINGDVLSSIITFTWKASYSHPLPVDKYHLIISASKNYPHKPFFQTINTTTSNLKYSVPSINFAAANIQINITADIQGVMTSPEPFNLIVQPKDPPSPGLTKNLISNETNNATIVTLTSSSDINGPISYYEIVISTSENTNLSNQLKSQAESELENIDYFLAATVKTNDFTANSMQYTFVEGKEYIAGLNARISVVGSYYLYARAVIDGKDIARYGFNNVNYFGHLSKEILIERNSLGRIVPDIVTSTKTSVMLVKGPATLKYHYVIIMKVNKTTGHVKEPRLYAQDQLITYETADYNEPYIAGIFNKTQLLNLKEFILGDNSTYSKSAGTLRRRRSIEEYRNGPLTVGETYVVFQRLQVQDVFYSTAWSKEFIVHKVGKKKVGPQSPSSSSKLSLIIGICVSSLIVIVLIGAIIYKRKVATSRTKSTESEDEKSIGASNYQDLTGIGQSVSKDTYEELQNVTKSGSTYEQIPMTKVQQKKMDTSQFSNHFIRESSSNYKGLKKELNSFVQNSDYHHSKSKAATNDVIEIISNKNRCVGYSIFQGINISNSFDIWKRIFREAFPVVVVIRSCEQLRSDKFLNCLVGETEKHGDYDVRLCQTIVYKDHTTQEVEVSFGQHKHKLCLYEFEVLPLMEYVASTEYLMNTCRAFNRVIQTMQNTRISFIDNSGYGFDIILIVVIEMMVLIKEKGTVDIYNFLTMIFSKVPSLKVTLEQYLIMHKVIWEFITYGGKYMSVADFQNKYKNFRMEKDDKGRYLFEIEFEKQNELRKSLRYNFDVASIDLNVSKNRFRGVLAGHKGPVVVSVPPDYINAVYVDSYQKRNAFIATQAPLEETVLDFWGMVVKENVTTIIMLYTFNEDRATDYPVFWKFQEDNLKEIKVKLVSEMMNGVVMLRSFFVSVKADTHVVNILQLTNWSLNNLPKVEDVKLIVEELKKSQERLDHGTIVVTCSDGAYRSGTFIACLNALEQIKVEEGVDVFNIVRCMRQGRPEFILNEHQYRFVYEVVNSFMENNSAYEYINT